MIHSDSQLAITRAQLDITKAKNEDDRIQQEGKLASDLFPQLISDNPTHRALALTLLQRAWRTERWGEVVAVLAVSDNDSQVRKIAIGQLGSLDSTVAVATLGKIAVDKDRPIEERALAFNSDCDVTLWNHVYHSQRLIVKNRCVSVTGTIVDATNGKQLDGVRHEADGDSHGWLKVDSEFQNLLNAGNTSDEGGNLVFEII